MGWVDGVGVWGCTVGTAFGGRGGGGGKKVWWGFTKQAEAVQVTYDAGQVCKGWEVGPRERVSGRGPHVCVFGGG
jgi:hypothetical protein